MKQRAKRVPPDVALHRHIARYMRTRGWSIVASGPISIEKRGERKYLYRWVLDFVGKPTASV